RGRSPLEPGPRALPCGGQAADRRGAVGAAAAAARRGRPGAGRSGRVRRRTRQLTPAPAQPVPKLVPDRRAVRVVVELAPAPPFLIARAVPPGQRKREA